MSEERTDRDDQPSEQQAARTEDADRPVTAADVISPTSSHDEPVAATSTSLPPFARFNVLVNAPDNVVARELLERLEKARVESSNLSYLAIERRGDGEIADEAVTARDGVADHDARVDVDTHVARQVGKGAATGAATGAVGGAIAGLALMLVPGVGTIAGGGLLAAAIGGAAAGGDLGLVWGGFRKLAVSPAWEHTFVSVDAGRAVVGVHTDDEAELRRAWNVLRTEGLDPHWFDRDGSPTGVPAEAGAPGDVPRGS